MTDVADAPEIEVGDSEGTGVEAPAAAEESDAPRRRSGGRRGSAESPEQGELAVEEPAYSAPTGGSLANALRELVSGIDQEVTAITNLSADVDAHVMALNDLRAEATRRLLHLDDLRAAAEDVNLSAFLDTSIQPQLPQIEEDFPDRIYGG